jgi:hypothetical protein
VSAFVSAINLRSWIRLAAGTALAVLAVSAPLLAAGPSTPSSGSSNKPKASAPSTSRLPPSTSLGTSTGTTPFAWVDDATLLPVGVGALTVSAASWHGTDASETEIPVVGAAVGVAPRFQLSARVPYIVDDPASGVVGGWGTTYLSGKIGLLQNASGVKLSVAPTLQIFGSGAVTLPGEGRAHWGIPVSVEGDSGSARAFASAGYFSGGIGFVGGGVSVDVTPRLTLSTSLSHAWSSSDTTSPVGVGSEPTRTEISGGASISLSSHFAVFGAVSQTIATTDANGAGLTAVAGVSVLAGSFTSHR